MSAEPSCGLSNVLVICPAFFGWIEPDLLDGVPVARRAAPALWIAGTGVLIEGLAVRQELMIFALVAPEQY